MDNVKEINKESKEEQELLYEMNNNRDGYELVKNLSNLEQQQDIESTRKQSSSSEKLINNDSAKNNNKAYNDQNINNAYIDVYQNPNNNIENESLKEYDN